VTRGRFRGTRGWLGVKSRGIDVEGVIVAVKTVAIFLEHRALVVDPRQSSHGHALHLADSLHNGQGRFNVERIAELDHANDNSR